MMDDAVYKIIEIVGSSPISIEDAIQNAINSSSYTLKHLRWFNVIETRGNIEEGKVRTYQVVLKMGFHIEGKSGPNPPVFDPVLSSL